MNRDQLLHRSERRGVDLFAGARGWEARAHKTLGIDLLGIEHWEPAVKTSEAAGLRTLHADVAALNPLDFADEMGEDGMLVGSPPCQSRSNAGKQLGALDVAQVAWCMQELARGHDTREARKGNCADKRSILTVEPLRWALALMPRVVLLEQVPPVLPDWKLVGSLLEHVGYSWWAGILEAERYGVPQTRERAVLIARRDGVPAHPPTPTHHRFVPNEPRQAASEDLFGAVMPWVSMAEALGWGMTERPSTTIVTGANGGGSEPLSSGSGGRAAIARERARGAWVAMRSNYSDGTTRERGERSIDELAFAVTSKIDRNFWMRANAQANASVRNVDEPAPTITGGHDTANRQWVYERPSTTVNGDPRISQPGHHDENESGSQQKDAIRVTVPEAAAIQSFPADWPWIGNKTQIYQQIGNAVPPLLGEAILRTVVDVASLERAA